MDTFIAHFFAYISLSMLSVAILLSAISFFAHRKHLNSQEATQIALLYLLLFCSGMGFLWDSIFYATLPGAGTGLEGLFALPLSWQVSAAYAAIALICIVGAFSHHYFRLAAIVLSTITMWSQGIADVYFNHAAILAQPVLTYLNISADLLVPFLLIGLYMVSHKHQEKAVSAQA